MPITNWARYKDWFVYVGKEKPQISFQHVLCIAWEYFKHTYMLRLYFKMHICIIIPSVGFRANEQLAGADIFSGILTNIFSY